MIRSSTLRDSLSSVGQLSLHTFSGQAGDVITLRVTRHSQNACCLEPAVAVFDASGAVVAAAGAGFGSPTTALTTTLQATGTFSVLVRDRDSQRFGRYGLSIHRISNPIGHPIAFGVLGQDSLLGAGHLVLHTFAGGAGDVISLRVTRLSQSGCCLEPSIAIYEQNGQLVAQGSAAFGSPSAAINATLPSAGTFAVIVRDRDSLVFGRYSVNLTLLGSPALLSRGQPSPDEENARSR